MRAWKCAVMPCSKGIKQERVLILLPIWNNHADEENGHDMERLQPRDPRIITLLKSTCNMPVMVCFSRLKFDKI